MAKVFDFFKERYVFITYCLFIFFALFSCFWSWGAFALVGVLAIGAIFFNVNQLIGLILFSKCFDVLYRIGNSVNDANLCSYIYAYFIVVLGIKYLITLFKTDEEMTFKQHLILALKRINWKILIPILVLIIYWLLPIHTTSIKAVGVNSLDFIFLYLVFEMRKEIKFSYVVKMFCLGLVISGLMALLRPVSERLDLILSYYTNYGYLRFSGLLWHANHMGMIAVIAIAALFLLKYQNKIGLFGFYVFLISIYIFGYCSISRNFIINFLIVLCLFFVAYIVKYKKESIKPLCIMFIIFVAISGIFFNETKINLVRLNVLPEFVIVNEESSNPAEWARIDFESDIDEGEYIKYSDEWWKEVYRGNIRYDPGREEIWSEYFNDWESSITSIMFGRGVAQPYVGAMPTHNMYLEILWKNGLFGVLIYLWILFSLINFKKFKQIKYCWTSIFLIVPFLVMGIVESSPMTNIIIPFLILYLSESFREEEQKEKFVFVTDTTNNKVKTQLKDVCAVVVTYNRKVLLRENVEALKAQTYKNLKILIIDNASTDGTKEYIHDLIDDKKVKYFNTGANLGGAGGFNYGMKKAVLIGCDYVWVMDDDCIPEKDSLKVLFDNAQKLNNNFGYLSSKVLWKDGSICNMNIQKVNLKSKVDTSKTELTKIKLASFVSLFLKREVIEEVGLPIKDFFIWGDDLEYTNRISKKYSCYYCSESVVVHKCNTNIGSNISKDESDRIDRYKYAYRNECYLYRQNGFLGLLYLLIKKWLHIFRVLFSKVKDKKKRLDIICKNTRLGFKFNPKIEYVFNKDTKINVLEFFAEPLEYGGEEAFMVNMYKNFNAKNINYTIFTPFNLTNKKLIEIAESRNEKIIHYDYKFFSKLKKFYVLKSFKKVLKSQKFDVVHIQSSALFNLCFCSEMAKKNGVKKVIVHSHNTRGKNGILNKLIKKYSDTRIEKYTDKFFACSMLAGEHKFPKSVMDENRCLVIKNGIDTQKFEFNEKIRKEYRQKLGLKPGEFVLLNVGRFAEQKNHKFMIELVEKLKEKLKNFKFILIGEGELKEQTLKEIKEKGLEKFFIILEKRNDVSEIMMACDMFIFPSVFEGLGIVAIEAQCSGLKTLVSTAIPQEANLTDLIKYLELNTDVWVDKILKLKDEKVNREKYSKFVKDSGYDAKTSAEILERIYLGE